MERFFSSLKFIVNCKYSYDNKLKHLKILILKYIPDTLFGWLKLIFKILKYLLHISAYFIAIYAIIFYDFFDIINYILDNTSPNPDLSFQGQGGEDTNPNNQGLENS